jgi:hypothetical protein
MLVEAVKLPVHALHPSPVWHAPVLKVWPAVAPFKHWLALCSRPTNHLALHVQRHLVARHLQGGQVCGVHA